MHFLKIEKTKKNIFHCHSRDLSSEALAKLEGGNPYKNFITKLSVFASLVLFLLPAFIYADTLEQQRDNKQQQKNQTVTQKNGLVNEAGALDNQINQLQSQINKTTSDINKTDMEINETKNNIKQAEIDLKKQKELMGEYLRTMYVEGQVSTIELIAKAKNFSDFVDQSEYMGTMQQNVQETANKVINLKQTLEQKKKNLDIKREKSRELQISQTSQQQSIQSLRNIKTTAISNANGQLSVLNKDISYLNWLIWLRDNGTNSSGNLGGGSGNYPYANRVQDSGWDEWGFYYRECTSYAAWRDAKIQGGPISSSDLSRWGHTETANATDWIRLAQNYGYRVSNSPSIGSIMVMPASLIGGVGHVAVVDSVNGSTVLISDYNWHLDGTYWQHQVSSSGSYFITR